MGEMGEHAWIISIIGDVLTLFGAAWTARAVFLTLAQAAGAAATTWDRNEQLKNALLKKNNDAKNGLVCVAVGTGFRLSASSSTNSPQDRAKAAALGRAGSRAVRSGAGQRHLLTVN